MPKKKRPVGRPKLLTNERGKYQLTLWKFFNSKGKSDDKNDHNRK